MKYKKSTPKKTLLSYVTMLWNNFHTSHCGNNWNYFTVP